MTAPPPASARPPRRLLIAVAGGVVVAASCALLLSANGPAASFEVRGTGNGPVKPGPDGKGVTNGGVSNTGRFTISGAVRDSGTYVAYRRVTGGVATIRQRLTGHHGSITLVTTVHLGGSSDPPWKVTQGTGDYAGLRAEGRLTVDNYQDDPYTFVMKGTLSP